MPRCIGFRAEDETEWPAILENQVRRQNNALPHSSKYLTIQRKGHHPGRSPSHLLQELTKEISKKNFFQTYPTLAFPVARNGVVVVHGFGEAFIEDTSIWAAVPCIPPLPVLAGVFGRATSRTLFPGIAVADRFRIHWV